MKQSEEKKIKDTGLGKWSSLKHPTCLMLSETFSRGGGLGIVKNLIEKDPDVNTEEGVAAVDAEIQFQNNVTERWKADMGSDEAVKPIRPVTLIALMTMFMVTMVADSMDNPFNVKDSYVDAADTNANSIWCILRWSYNRKGKVIMEEEFEDVGFLDQDKLKKQEKIEDGEITCNIDSPEDGVMQRLIGLIFLMPLFAVATGWVSITIQGMVTERTTWLVRDSSNAVVSSALFG